ncbi:DUF4342 domain-containing protein [Patescibacteria group bacterium]
MENSEFKVSGEDLLKRVKKLIKEGNVRRIIIKDEKGRKFLEIPVTVGVLGALAAPIFVAVGAVAALASKFTIEVIKSKPKKKVAKKKK